MAERFSAHATWRLLLSLPPGRDNCANATDFAVAWAGAWEGISLGAVLCEVGRAAGEWRSGAPGAEPLCSDTVRGALMAAHQAVQRLAQQGAPGISRTVYGFLGFLGLLGFLVFLGVLGVLGFLGF